MINLRAADFEEVSAHWLLDQDDYLHTLLTLMAVAAAAHLGSIIVEGPSLYHVNAEAAEWANAHGASLVRLPRRP